MRSKFIKFEIDINALTIPLLVDVDISNYGLILFEESKIAYNIGASGGPIIGANGSKLDDTLWVLAYNLNEQLEGRSAMNSDLENFLYSNGITLPLHNPKIRINAKVSFNIRNIKLGGKVIPLLPDTIEDESNNYILERTFNYQVKLIRQDTNNIVLNIFAPSLHFMFFDLNRIYMNLQKKGAMTNV